MQLELSDEETLALLNLLTETIEADRYPLSPRIRTLRGILHKFGPMGPAPPPPARRLKNAIPTVHRARVGGEGEVRGESGLPDLCLRPREATGVNRVSAPAPAPLPRDRSRLTGTGARKCRMSSRWSNARAKLVCVWARVLAR